LDALLDLARTTLNTPEAVLTILPIIILLMITGLKKMGLESKDAPTAVTVLSVVGAGVVSIAYGYEYQTALTAITASMASGTVYELARRWFKIEL